MTNHLPDIEIGVMQEDIAVFMGIFYGIDKIVLHVFIGMAPVNKGDLDPRQLVRFIERKELVVSQLVMLDEILYAKLSEMVIHLYLITPFVYTPHRHQRSVLQQGV